MTERNKRSYGPKTQPLTGLCLALIVCLAPFSAHAQQDERDRLNRLENEIQTLSRAVFRGEMPSPGVVEGMQADDASGSGGESRAALELRLSQMEADLRTLTGRMEEQDYTIRSLQEKVEKSLADMEMRLGSAPSPGGSGEFGGGLPPQPDTPYSVGDPDAPAPSGAPTEGTLGSFGQNGAVAGAAGEYEQAFALLKNSSYQEAELAFTAFLDRYPDDPLASNARYWLSETFYARHDYERAAREFAAAYQKDPKGPKGADSLLKLGLSLAGMGKKSDACLVFEQLKRDYPTGAGPVTARADREAQTLGCTGGAAAE